MRRPAVLLCAALLCTVLNGSAVTGAPAAAGAPHEIGTTTAEPAPVHAGPDGPAGGLWSTAGPGLEALLAVALLLLIAGLMTGAHLRWSGLSA